MRGGGPGTSVKPKRKRRSSPHARGWSGPPRRESPQPPGLPRMRGGGPRQAEPQPLSLSSSPHARGWSQHGAVILRASSVFPACAGVVPRAPRRPCEKSSLPRMRGGGPRSMSEFITVKESSPHARGWSRSRRPNCLHVIVFPACAGVVPHNPPQHQAQARLPRMRGGGPQASNALRLPTGSSPHARGWSQADVTQAWKNYVFPACAGVVRTAPTASPSRSCLPRMRGGGPAPHWCARLPFESSPHARGWSLAGE